MGRYSNTSYSHLAVRVERPSWTIGLGGWEALHLFRHPVGPDRSELEAIEFPGRDRSSVDNTDRLALYPIVETHCAPGADDGNWNQRDVCPY